MRDRHEARLHITGVVHGSFGFELAELQGPTSFDGAPLRDAVDLATRAIIAAGEIEDALADAAEGLDARAFVALGEFFTVLVSCETIELGGEHCVVGVARDVTKLVKLGQSVEKFEGKAPDVDWNAADVQAGVADIPGLDIRAALYLRHEAQLEAVRRQRHSAEARRTALVAYARFRCSVMTSWAGSEWSTRP